MHAAPLPLGTLRLAAKAGGPARLQLAIPDLERTDGAGRVSLCGPDLHR